MGESVMSLERTFSAPAEIVWAVLADTNRYNRALKQGPTLYGWKDVGSARHRVAEAMRGRVHMTWVEPPFEWIEGRYLASHRDFTSGPIERGGLRIDVEPVAAGSRVRISMFGVPRSLALKLAAPIVRMVLKSQMRSWLDTVERVLAEAPQLTEGVPPAVAAAIMLQQQNYSEAAVGPTTAPHRGELERRAARLAAAPVDAQARARLVATIAERPDEEVSQMRPFALARAWGIDRREVLRTFLHGTRAGLVDLNWQINCPVCKVAAGVVRTLAEVEKAIHCDACNIRYDIDFGANVEAVFRCSSAIRQVEPAVFCAASPAFRPHVIAQLRAPAGQRVEHTLMQQDGRLHLRTLGRQRAADTDAVDPPAEIVVRVLADRLEVATSGRAAGSTKLVILSEIADDAYVLVERGAWSTDAVLGSVVASLPDFMDLFGTEAPAAGLELSIGNLTLLFSDLTGSTALYERVGDARAFAIVQEHFRRTEAIIHERGGAVVKTMGDAVMASFARPQDAVRAARAMVADANAVHGELGIGIKLGLHEGPCLAVRANDRLDFFGTTVNLAARLLGQATTSVLVLSRELAELPDVRAELEGLPARSFRSALKGIRAEQDLVAFSLAADASTEKVATG
jgi:class 3 adenylate cyclase